MIHIFNKVIILLCCTVFSLSSMNQETIILPLLLAITFTALSSYFFKQRLSIFILIGFIFICIFLVPSIYFIPLFCYDVFLEEYQFLIGLVTIPLLIHYTHVNGLQLVLLTILALVAFILKKHAFTIKSAHTQYTHLRDQTLELSNNLEEKNRELLEKQDYEVNLATLNERNRIAREIHDSVGHTLASSILQIGALMTISKESATKDQLSNLKDTLSTGMDDIRHSIHNIHEESVDLAASLTSLANDFNFCPVELDYNITTDLSLKARYSIIHIVKESLSNVMKHSNATKVSLQFIEHPGFYQIILKDNGTISSATHIDMGMGMTSMQNRVSTLDGNISWNTKDGFLIFITLPKRRNSK